ncbi:MAG: adenosine deaminase, partial [Lachnospiraceae bacterium]|nr:adenosine deaminase [Lachnospiraceae bacterium]
IESGILVCAMRHMSLEDNLAVLKAAREHLGSGVVGFDIAGDEAAFPMEMFTNLFHEAKRLEIPYTIHAGECGRAENVRGAIELGTRRVGHGIAMDGHTDIMKMCVDHHVGVEMCPTSNLQTHALESLNDYPIRRYLDAGIPVSINTDNRTVSGITLSHEYQVLDDIFHFTEDELRCIYRDSVDVAFASDDVKEALLKKF